MGLVGMGLCTVCTGMIQGIGAQGRCAWVTSGAQETLGQEYLRFTGACVYGLEHLVSVVYVVHQLSLLYTEQKEAMQ